MTRNFKLCTLLLAPALALAQTGAPRKNAPPAAPAASAAAAALNPLTVVMQNAGVVRCLPQIERITQFIASGSESGTVVFPAAKNPDDSLLSISTELNTGGQLSYAEANFAPRSNGCSASYEHVVHWQNSCDEVYAARYTEFQAQGKLQQHIRVYFNVPGTRIMLIPAGAGCVAIKKEVVH